MRLPLDIWDEAFQRFSFSYTYRSKKLFSLVNSGKNGDKILNISTTI